MDGEVIQSKRIDQRIQKITQVWFPWVLIVFDQFLSHRLFDFYHGVFFCGLWVVP